MAKNHLSKFTISSMLLALSVTAVIVRFLPLNHVISVHSTYLFDGDSYVHIRKILLHVKNFPYFVTFDYFEGFPKGTPAIWPPLLDYFLSLLSIVLTFGEPTVRQVELIASTVPPIIGGLTLVAVYHFSKCLFNKAIALISVLILAFLPSHIFATIIGRPDNEMLEPLMVTLLFLSYLKLQKSCTVDPAGLKRALLSSIVALFTLLLWRGATLWIMLIFLAFLIDIIVDILKANSSSKRYVNGAIMFASSAESVGRG